MKQVAALLCVILMVPTFALADRPSSPPVSPGQSSRHPSPCTLHPDSAAPRANATNYADVLLLVNNQSQISMQVGNYFKAKRNVPDNNVCNISMPTSEWIDTTQFGRVRNAVEAFITNAGLNDTLDYIVTTKGCPLGVWDQNNRYASFMDELGLIMGPYAGAIDNQYWLTNPFGGSEERFSRRDVGIFIVTRIDGYDLKDCLGLIDLASNATGSRGTFVLDSQPWKDGSGYQSGNDWCRSANRTLSAKGWKCLLDDTPWYVVDRDNVSGYCSWGSNDGNAGNNAKPNFTWVPGALGSTYVSTSARSFAYPPSYGQSLIADLVREGITGVHGNVAEPYLDACARPQYFLERYTRGWNLGESFYAGMATQSWQNCVIGDPKIEAYSDQPDPAVFGPDITFSEASLVQGMDMDITARVRNLGGGPARDATAAFFDGPPGKGGTQIGDNVAMDVIPAGGSSTVKVAWNLSKLYGAHVVYVCVTASNITPQLWNGNDLASRNATIFTRPDLAVPRDRLSVSRTSPLEGDTIWINATVRNIGGFMATSLLRFWVDGALVYEVNFSLMGGEETRPGAAWNSEGSPGPHRVTVEALAVAYEAELSNNDATADVFVRHFDIALSSDAASRDCLPGQTAVFNVTVRSLSNTAEAVSVGLSPSPDYWAGAVEPERVQLEPGASSNHTVTVTAPDLGLAGDRWDIVLRCEGQSGGVQRQTNLSVAVLPVRQLVLACEPEEGTAMPGGNATFKLAVRNLGNGPDTANFTFSAPEGWSVRFESASSELAHKGSGSVPFKVTPPPAALAGERREITVTATSLGGRSWNATVTVEVEQVFGFESAVDAASLDLTPGVDGVARIRVVNTGNGDETFRVNVQSGVLQASLSETTLVLGAFSEGNVTLNVKAPEKLTGDAADIVVTVDPAHSPEALHWIAVNVVRPDIVLPKELAHVNPAYPSEGALATVTVEVRNAGKAPTGPVSVRLTEFGSTVGNFTIDDLAAGATAKVVFAWTAGSAGLHELVVTAECRIRDPTPADGTVSVPVTVVPKKAVTPPAGGGSGPSTAVLAGGLLLVLAAAAVVAFFVMRRKPPEPAPHVPADMARAGFSLVDGETGGGPGR